MKLDWEIGGATLTSISVYSKLDQDLYGSTSWQTPPGFGFCGPIGGAGEPPDCFQVLVDDFEVMSQDLRLTSRSDQRLRWLVGAAYLDREAGNLLRIGAAALDSNGSVVPGPAPFLDRADLRRDRVSGIYGQINYDVTQALEATVALRWDENRYDTTQYTTLDFVTPVPTPDGEITQRAKDSELQPKVQLAYRWNDALMTYLGYARGFRTGFFNTGTLTQAETTSNYELGFKATLWDRRMQLNGAVFHIDYSNQQFTTIIPTPPFRATENISGTSIDGLELEGIVQPLYHWNISAGLGVTKAEVDDGTTAPSTPDYTLNLSTDYTLDLNASWSLIGRVDYRRQASQYLARNERFEIGPKDYVNLRLALDGQRWKWTAYVDNALDERQANEVNNVGFGYIRVPNRPRTYGLEFSFKL